LGRNKDKEAPMASNQSVLEQMLQAALSGGGLRQPDGGSAGSGGGLGDVLGGLLGAAAGGASSGRQGTAGGGGLGDVLGGLLGAASGGAAPSGGAGGSGGLGDVLGSLLGAAAGAGGAAPAGRPGAGGAGGLGDLLGSVLGGQSGKGDAAPTSRPDAGGTGGLGDLLGSVLGGQSGAGGMDAPASVPAPDRRQPGGSEAGSGINDLVRYGGMAVIGVLAYQALKRFQAKQGAVQADNAAIVPPIDSGFHPAQAPGGADAFAGILVKAMVAATQADGVIDEEEQRRLIGRLDQLGMNSGDRHALIEQLRTPVNLREIVAAGSSPELALQIYAASAMAVKIDTPAERTYLDQLAAHLGLDPGLKAQVEQTVGRA